MNFVETCGKKNEEDVTLDELTGGIRLAVYMTEGLNHFVLK